MSGPTIERSGREAPGELHNEDGEIEYVRADGLTRGQAEAFFASEMDLDFTDTAVHRVHMCYDTEYAAEMEADGIPEPYDGWPWTECSPGAPGAVAYWRGSKVGTWVRARIPEPSTTAHREVDGG